MATITRVKHSHNVQVTGRMVRNVHMAKARTINPIVFFRNSSQAPLLGSCTPNIPTNMNGTPMPSAKINNSTAPKKRLPFEILTKIVPKIGPIQGADKGPKTTPVKKGAQIPERVDHDWSRFWAEVDMLNSKAPKRDRPKIKNKILITMIKLADPKIDPNTFPDSTANIPSNEYIIAMPITSAKVKIAALFFEISRIPMTAIVMGIMG